MRCWNCGQEKEKGHVHENGDFTCTACSLSPLGLTLFNRGFDHGNYEHAYRSENFAAIDSGNDVYYCGCILGFFSSYEIDEIPLEYQDEVARLREKYADHI